MVIDSEIESKNIPNRRWNDLTVECKYRPGPMSRNDRERHAKEQMTQ